MSGRLVGLGLVGFALVFGAALVWFQFFAFYERQRDLPTVEIGGVPVLVSGYDGIDATSSPLKLRGCFRIDPVAMAGLAPVTDAVPLTPPFWFRCFDAGALTRDLQAGVAQAYRVGVDQPEGFDRMIAVYPDGRGYLWRQLDDAFAE